VRGSPWHADRVAPLSTERGPEAHLDSVKLTMPAPLQIAIDDRYQNHETDMQGLRRIELPEIAGVVGNEDEIALSGIADDVPVFPAGPADTGDVLGFMAGYPGDSDQVDAEAFVDQKPHDTAMVSSFRRLRRNGC